MIRHIGGFVLGFSAPAHGLQLILTRRHLHRWVLIPILVGIFIVLAGFIGGIYLLSNLLPFFVTNVLTLFFELLHVSVASSSAFIFLYWFTLILAWPASLIALGYLLFLMAKLLAAPFFALLAEKVLSRRGVTHLRGLSRFHLLAASVTKLGIFSSVGLVFFVLSLIPGLGIFTTFGFCVLMALDTVDASLEVMQMPLSERATFVRQNFGFISGLAVALGLAFLIPGLNFVVLPAAIAGSADRMPLLFGKHSKSKDVARTN